VPAVSAPKVAPRRARGPRPHRERQRQRRPAVWAGPGRAGGGAPDRVLLPGRLFCPPGLPVQRARGVRIVRAAGVVVGGGRRGAAGAEGDGDGVKLADVVAAALAAGVDGEAAAREWNGWTDGRKEEREAGKQGGSEGGESKGGRQAVRD
jgi:hypothetical protein